MRRALLVLVAVTGCSVVRSSGPDAAVADADAAVPDAELDQLRMPFTTVGTTPVGSLDEVRFIGINFLSGFCEPGYYIDLYRTNELYDAAVVHFRIPFEDPIAEPPTGTIAASAWPGEFYGLRTDLLSFDIAQLDLPPTSPLRIAGRMSIHMDAWNIDFTVDALTLGTTCL